jgi:hypothetical protein
MLRVGRFAARSLGSPPFLSRVTALTLWQAMLGQIDITDFVRSRYALGAVSMVAIYFKVFLFDDTPAQSRLAFSTIIRPSLSSSASRFFS